MSVTFDGSVAEAEAAITEALKNVGFGVLTRIDVAETLKNKIGVDRPPYVILGACNPKLAHRALEAAPEVGLLLPCNVVVREDESGRTEVSIVNPDAMLGVIDRPELAALADEARPLFRQALEAIGG
jgi:uncharacterized protein (DUF302 family)